MKFKNMPNMDKKKIIDTLYHETFSFTQSLSTMDRLSIANIYNTTPAQIESIEKKMLKLFEH